MTSTLRAYLELARPANVVTAFADILAGFAAAWASSVHIIHGQGGVTAAAVPEWGLGTLFALLAATAGLYAGGVVLNDVFDAPIDAAERPERPIPSGRVTRKAAAVFGSLLLVVGIVAAASAGPVPGLIALLIALGAVTYDAAGKHHPILGPVNMGLCRGGNLLLGVSAVPALLGSIWYVGLLPVAYIGAITAVSRGEVHGGMRRTGVLALTLIVVVTAALLMLGLRPDFRTASSLPFIALFGLLVFPPFIRAALEPSPDRIRHAVKRGVLSLVAMDAALAAGFGGWPFGIAVIILLPISVGLARAFAVT